MKRIFSIEIILIIVLAACGRGQSRQSTASDSFQRESPVLAYRVSSGELPPLAQRLPSPASIMVEQMDSTGAYGDAMTFFHNGTSTQWGYGMMTEESLFRFNVNGEIEPNVAKDFSVNSDSTEFTIYLREGMKWSDGVSFTADDCIFFYEEMALKTSWGNAVSSCFYSTNPLTLERALAAMHKVNDYEFAVRFQYPNPNFLEMVAIDSKWMFAPSHYHRELLPWIAGEETALARAEELGFPGNVSAMNRQTGYYYWNIVGLPTLRPWLAVNHPDSDLFIMERNPYYWKTDADGRQLPYIDQLHFMRIADVNQRVLMVMAGDVDVDTGLPWSSVAELNARQNQGNYNLATWDAADWAGTGSLVFLQSSSNPSLRALFQNRNFREAVSISADRREMAELVSGGWSEPRQSSPPQGAFGYSAAWSQKWIEYDPPRARNLLEGIGLIMGADGFFSHPDGSRLVLDIMTHDNSPETARAAELLTEKYLRDIGIRATFTVRERGFLDEQVRANLVDVSIQSAYGMGSVNVALRPDSLIPLRNNFSAWYGSFGTWFATNGEGGERPEGDILRLTELFGEMRASTTREGINEIAMQILGIHEENIWQIGFLSPMPVLISVNKDIRNFNTDGIWCDEFRTLGLARPLIWYFASDKTW